MTGHPHAGTGGPLLVVLVALAYELAALRVRDWNPWRGAAFAAGCTVLAAGLALPSGGAAGHMARHVLVAMLAPLGLVLGAPVTLALRRLPVRHARTLTRILRGRPARLLAHPVTALALSSGGLLVLYLTPLYRAAQAHPAVHTAVLVHLVLSGCLFAWVVAGPDPAPHRPAVTTRLVLLGVAVAVHATLSQLIYAGAWVDLPADVPDRQAAATIMYYGGDIAELLLAFAVVQSRAGRRRGRQPGPAGSAAGPAVSPARAYAVHGRS